MSEKRTALVSYATGNSGVAGHHRVSVPREPWAAEAYLDPDHAETAPARGLRSHGPEPKLYGAELIAHVKRVIREVAAS